MTMDWPILAALATVGGFAIAFATFWMRFGSRIARAEAVADESLKASEQSKRDSQEISNTLAIQTAQFSLYREQIARDYIHREVMREVEDRLTAAIDRLGDRLDRVLERADHK